MLETAAVKPWRKNEMETTAAVLAEDGSGGAWQGIQQPTRTEVACGGDPASREDGGGGDPVAREDSGPGIRQLAATGMGRWAATAACGWERERESAAAAACGWDRERMRRLGRSEERRVGKECRN